MTGLLVAVIVLVLLVGTVMFIKLNRIHVLVNSRLTTALNEITALKSLLAERGVTPPPSAP